MNELWSDGPKIPLVYPSFGPGTHALSGQAARANISVSWDELLDRLTAANRERNASDRLGRAKSQDRAGTGAAPEYIRDWIEG